MTTFKPLEDRVLVRKKEKAQMTMGGIYVPGNHQSLLEIGEVVAVGPGRLLQDGTLVTRDLEVGCSVMYRKDVALEVQVEGESFDLLEGYDLLGVME